MDKTCINASVYRPNIMLFVGTIRICPQDELCSTGMSSGPIFITIFMPIQWHKKMFLNRGAIKILRTKRAENLPKCLQITTILCYLAIKWMLTKFHSKAK